MKKLIRKAAKGLGFSASDIACKPVASLHFPLRLTKEIENRLHQIPSQTSPAERRFLYQFFSQLWTGSGDVVEIGPFLGGTTRAIALGMLHNPRRSDGRLYTFDRFKDYFEVSDLPDYLQPLIDAGELQQSDINRLGKRAPFIDVFRKLHSDSDYFDCVVTCDKGVPDLPEISFLVISGRTKIVV